MDTDSETQSIPYENYQTLQQKYSEVIENIQTLSEKIIKKNEKYEKYPQSFFDSMIVDPTTLSELRMMTLSQKIRLKENWKEKMKDKEIVRKWKEESLKELKEVEVDFVLDELKYYAKLNENGIEIDVIDGIWQFNDGVDKELAKKFKETVFSLLEDVPDDKKDYHPNSNKKVVDLVHPSLFPFVLNRTVAPISLVERITSTKFQWLPSEFEVDHEGKVEIKSYINNLHPEMHKALYPLIGKIFELFIPLFEKVLADYYHPRPKRVQDEDYWYDEEEIDYANSTDDNEHYQSWIDHRTIIEFPVGVFVEPLSIPKVSLKNTTLQVIVKLANIEISPESPVYDGGAWHVEGTEAESIIATGIYYYDSENITESRLSFRQAVTDQFYYMQNDDKGVEKIFGLTDGNPLNQPLGYVLTKKGKMLGFPNKYQHRVESFELENPTIKGFRKILVFFLVDPKVKVLSTVDVPPQQRDWMDWSKVNLNQTMTMDEAKAYRELLIDERKVLDYSFEGDLFERSFSLCEH